MGEITGEVGDFGAFIGKTVAAVDASVCNNIQFLFSDGSSLALHIDLNWRGFPDIEVCTDCATIGRQHLLDEGLSGLMQGRS